MSENQYVFAGLEVDLAFSRLDRMARFLEKEIRHPTRRHRFWTSETCRWPPLSSGRMVSVRVALGRTGFSGHGWVWTALPMGHLTKIYIKKKKKIKDKTNMSTKLPKYIYIIGNKTFIEIIEHCVHDGWRLWTSNKDTKYPVKIV